MPLQSSGAISLNDIHLEAGGTTSTEASLNDSDIRGLIDKASLNPNSFNEYYGASAGIPISTNEHIFFKGGSTYPYEKLRGIVTSNSKDTTVVLESYGAFASQQTPATVGQIDCFRFSGTSYSAGKRLSWTPPSANSGAVKVKQVHMFVDDDAIYLILGFGGNSIPNYYSNTQSNRFYIAKYNNSWTQQWQKRYTESGSGLWVGETFTNTSSESVSITNDSPGVSVMSCIDDADYIYVAASPSNSVYKINKSDGAVANKIRFARNSSYRLAAYERTKSAYPQTIISHSSNNSGLINCAFGHTAHCKLNKSNLTVNGSIRYTNTHYNSSTNHYSNTRAFGLRDDPSNGDWYTTSSAAYYDLKGNNLYNLFSRMSTSGSVTFRRYAERNAFTGVISALAVDGTYFYYTLSGNSSFYGSLVRINKSDGTHPTTMAKDIQVRNDANTGYQASDYVTGGLDHEYLGRTLARPDFHDGTNYENRENYWGVDDGDNNTSDDYGIVHIASNNWGHAFASSTVSKNGYQWVNGGFTASAPYTSQGAAGTSTEPSWTTHSSANTGITAANATFISTGTVGTPTFGGTASSNIITGTN